MRKYRAYFRIGQFGTVHEAIFTHECKHFSEIDFERDLKAYAKHIGGEYMYKEDTQN